MHCAKLFEVCSNPKTDAFQHAGCEKQKEARKVCIETILHTDNAFHFDMVKELGHIFTMTSDICDKQARENSLLLPRYKEDVLRKHSLVFMQMFLHLADVSNSL